MKLHFKLLFLMLITSITLQAQKHQIYSKSFDVNKHTTTIFNLEKTTVAIEESSDDKIHIDYAIEFKNYSKNEINEFLEPIEVEANLFENHFILTATSLTILTPTHYTFDSPFRLNLDMDFFKKNDKEKVVIKKSKDSIIEIIRNIRYTKNMLNKIYVFDKEGNEKPLDLDFSDIKLYKSHFIIKIPSYLKLNVNAKESQITFKDDVVNELKLNLKGGSLKGQTFANTYNNIKVENASFKVEEIIEGNYTLNNIRNGLIGSVEKAKITSEFSKIEIGEIGENVTITDFNSKYWFYNFSNNFKRFDVFSEYSKIHLFYPETDFSFEVFGNNTINHIDDIKIEMQPTRNGEKFHMMSRKANGKTHFSGTINFDIIHGVIYTYNDTFKPNKN